MSPLAAQPSPPPRDSGGRRHFAVVVPYLEEIQGNRHSLALAAELARRHEVSFHVGSGSPSALAAARTLLGNVPMTVLRTRPPRSPRMSRYMVRQFQRGLDRAIASEILQANRAHPIDEVLVCGNDGHWVADLLRRGSAGVPVRPRSSVLLFDLIDGVYLLRHARPHPSAREFLLPLHAALHWAERDRLREFDFRFVNSRWTAVLLESLYGWPTDGVLACIDTRTFTLPPAAPGAGGASPFLALPTASLTDDDARLARRLRADGVSLIAYGPRPIEGVEYRGYLPEGDLVQLVQSAAATLFLFDYEALGMTPLESLACGTPVITRARQGPGLELRGRPHVHFFRSYDEALALCRSMLATPRTATRSAECRQGIQEYSPEAAVTVLLNRLGV